MAKPDDPQFPWNVSEYDHDTYQTRREQNEALGAIFSVLEQIRDELRELNTATRSLVRRR